LEKKNLALQDILRHYNLCEPAAFTSDPVLTGKYWAMRSGIFPAVGGTREIGTTCLIEDIAFPIEHLAQATLDLQQLFIEHNYPDAVIYGHALEGNYHFILNQRFDSPQAIAQYDSMMRAVVDLVVDKYHGSLKAEHGTGRNMAPFVRREWGDAAYELMKEVKQLFDPENIMNPGVIFNEDEHSYIEHIKPLPEVHQMIDRCIECGFC
jgi:D-lactate dehydrogenase